MYLRVHFSSASFGFADAASLKTISEFLEMPYDIID